MPPPHRLPRPELPRQITPRDPAPIPVDDALHDRPCVRERTPLPARPGREERSDQRPLVIGEELEARPPTSISALPLALYETRPKRDASGTPGRQEHTGYTRVHRADSTNRPVDSEQIGTRSSRLTPWTTSSDSASSGSLATSF